MHEDLGRRPVETVDGVVEMTFDEWLRSAGWYPPDFAHSAEAEYSFLIMRTASWSRDIYLHLHPSKTVLF